MSFARGATANGATRFQRHRLSSGRPGGLERMHVCAPSRRRRVRFGRSGGFWELCSSCAHASAATQPSGVVLGSGVMPADSRCGQSASLRSAYSFSPTRGLITPGLPTSTGECVVLRVATRRRRCERPISLLSIKAQRWNTETGWVSRECVASARGMMVVQKADWGFAEVRSLARCSVWFGQVAGRMSAIRGPEGAGRWFSQFRQ